MDQNGPFWPEEAHFGPFRSANRTLSIPEIRIDPQIRPNRCDVFTQRIFQGYFLEITSQG